MGNLEWIEVLLPHSKGEETAELTSSVDGLSFNPYSYNNLFSKLPFSDDPMATYQHHKRSNALIYG